MPVSVYLRATILLIAAAAALFGSAGSLALPTFWLYWAILVAVFVAAFALLDRGLLQERMRPGGRPTPLGLRLLNVVLLTHWIIAGLDRGRLHWSDNVPLWLQALGLFTIVCGVCAGVLGDDDQSLFLLGRAHPVRPGTICGYEWAIRFGSPSRLQRRHSDLGGKRRRARLMARGRVSHRHYGAIPFLPRDP